MFRYNNIHHSTFDIIQCYFDTPLPGLVEYPATEGVSNTCHCASGMIVSLPDTDGKNLPVLEALHKQHRTRLTLFADEPLVYVDGTFSSWVSHTAGHI